MDQWSNDTVKTWFFVLLGVGVLIGLWLNIEPHACPVPTPLLSGEKPQQPPCFEFWLNRYQTLFGTFAAVGAAYFAWRGVMKQVERADAQIELMKRQVASDSLPDVVSRLNHVDRILDRMGSIAIGERIACEWMAEIEHDANCILDFVENEDSSYIDVYTGGLIPAKHAVDQTVKNLHDAHDSLFAETRNIVLPQDVHRKVILWLSNSTKTRRVIDNIARNIRLPANYDIPTKIFRDKIKDAGGYAGQRPKPQSLIEVPVFDLVRAERDRLSRVRDILARQAEGLA